MSTSLNELVLDIDPEDVAHNSPRYTLGAMYWWRGIFYKYVQFVDAVTYVKGHFCEYANTLGTAVTNDRASGSAVGNNKAGFACVVATQNQYGFIQVSGNGRWNAITDGSVAAGEYLTAHATTDGGLDTMADGTEEQVCAMANAADSSTAQVAGTYTIIGCM